MPKRLAITVSGAVSLGSFEAGVLYEITTAIGQHNENPATKPNDKIYIDVLTGASAGGMTVTIAAQELLYERTALDGAYANAFYSPWVVDVNINGLLNLGSAEDPEKSVFSSDFVTGISEKYLTARYQSHADVPRNPHPAINTGPNQKLYLGLAMSNLNGVDYGLLMQPGGTFVYTRHQDELTTWFDTNNLASDDTIDFWDPLRNAAVSCGAFAFAFRPVDVVRHDFEYKLPNLRNLANLVSQIPPVQSFSYTDGGTFQNEPLGLAKLLVDNIDNHRDVESRFYLYISPNAKSSTATPAADFNAGTANFKNTAVQLVGAIFAQARFQDWVTASEINEQVARFNASAAGLRDMILKNPGLAANLDATSNALLPTLIPDAAKLAAAQKRLQDQFANEYASLGPNGNSWINAILLLETAADLADSDEMTIYGITATDAELASSQLCAFAGFFDQTFRDHDYDVGRMKAQDFLSNKLFGLRAPIKYKPEPVRPLTPNLAGIELSKMDPNIRTTVRDRLRDRAMDLMKEADLSWAVREGVDLFFVKPELNKLLEL